MALPSTAPAGPGLSTPESALPVLVHSAEDTHGSLSGEKSTGSEESPVETDSPGDAEPEFKEGGYGWSVQGNHHFPGLIPGSPLCLRFFTNTGS